MKLKNYVTLKNACELLMADNQFTVEYSRNILKKISRVNLEPKEQFDDAEAELSLLSLNNLDKLICGNQYNINSNKVSDNTKYVLNQLFDMMIHDE